MRNFGSTFESIFTSNLAIEFFLLVEVGYKVSSDPSENEVLRLTTLPYSVTFNGNTFSKDIGLAYYESPKFNSITEKSSYRISIIDNDNLLQASARLGFVGQPMKIWLGVMNNGSPLLSVGEVLPAYEGTVDGVSQVDDFESRTINLEGASPMSSLDLVNVFMTSRNGMDQKNLDDTSFDSVFMQDDVMVKWGKI